MKLGVDIGYNAVKIFDGGSRVITFPSVVGTADVSRFTAGGISMTNAQIIQLEDETRWMYGSDAVEMSRILSRPEDRNWYNSKEYQVLLTAALRDILYNKTADKKIDNLNVVTGLPIMFYDDRKQLQSIYEQEHSFIDSDGNTVTYRISKCTVIPQPFGSLLNLALDGDGDVLDTTLARGTVGVIDCGGKTTNILTSSKMREVARLTTSVNVGGWDIVRAVRETLNLYHPEIDYRDSQIASIIVGNVIRKFGKDIDVTGIVNQAIVPFAETIIASATQLWNSGASLDRILLTGGASKFVYPFIVEKYPHVMMVDDPVACNVIGYYKFARRIYKE